MPKHPRMTPESMTTVEYIAFFGASVTDQDIHHATNEVTGFVSYFERNLTKDLGAGCRASRRDQAA
ncbi:hypothetical protein SAMN06265370_11861 [Puniceibacterium sediminis]|uniref:Uncharacterized protein n=2 Tax=Puniceibacterium sediminis TaxID=1608407 RepID=A0A238YPH4_9RHOB|nr:hypothetical protein SAMN06265370_11861 [Puniceibacterium sediminis]